MSVSSVVTVKFDVTLKSWVSESRLNSHAVLCDSTAVQRTLSRARWGEGGLGEVDGSGHLGAM